MLNREDPDVIDYLTAENNFADQWFAPWSSTIDSLFEEIKTRVKEDDVSVPVRHNGWWYVSQTQQGLSYVKHMRGTTSSTATEMVVLDENVEAQGHSYFSLSALEV